MVGDESGVLVEIAGFERFELLGSGGFSRVFRAYQPRFRRWVAVKVLNFDIVDGRAIRGFERECHAMGQVSSHPNIVTVLDNGVTLDDRPFIVMEYFEGGTYSDKLAQGPISVEELLRVGVKIAGALQTAHDAGILHRDLKPHNIFVSKFNEPALGDFGISSVDDSKTSTGFAGYTVHYAPPEVLNGERATVASDLYSLGATFYRLIEGVRPFDGSEQSMVATAIRIVTEDAPRVTRSDAPDRLVSLIGWLMAKDPTARPRSAAQVASEFQRIQAEAGFDVSRVMLAGAPGLSELPTVVSRDEVPTTFRSVTDPGGAGSSPSTGGSVPEQLPAPEDLGTVPPRKVEGDGSGPVSEPSGSHGVSGDDTGIDPDATIARSSLGGYTVAGTGLQGQVPEEVEMPDVVDPDATIARSSLTGYGVAGAATFRSGDAVVPDVSDLPDTSDVEEETDGGIGEPPRETVPHDVPLDDAASEASNEQLSEPVPELAIDDEAVQDTDSDAAASGEGTLLEPDPLAISEDSVATEDDERIGTDDSGGDTAVDDDAATVDGVVSVGAASIQDPAVPNEIDPEAEESDRSHEVSDSPIVAARSSNTMLVRRWNLPAAVIVIIVIVAAAVFALQATSRPDTVAEMSAAPTLPAPQTTAAPQTTVATTTTVKQVVKPPAPTGFTIRFTGLERLRATWDKTGSQSSDKYRLSGYGGTVTTSVYRASLRDVTAQEPCVTLVRIRDGEFSTATRACIDLAEPMSKSVEGMAPGNCFFRKDQPPGWNGTVEVVDCEARHDLEVFATFDASESFDTYPGKDAMVSWIEEQCDSAFSEYVGRPYSSSMYGYGMFFPNETTWRQGDRLGMCGLYEGDWEDPDDTRGSAKDVNL